CSNPLMRHVWCGDELVGHLGCVSFLPSAHVVSDCAGLSDLLSHKSFLAGDLAGPKFDHLGRQAILSAENKHRLVEPGSPQAAIPESLHFQNFSFRRHLFDSYLSPSMIIPRTTRGICGTSICVLARRSGEMPAHDPHPEAS